MGVLITRFHRSRHGEDARSSESVTTCSAARASYASVAASFLTAVNLVGIVGSDFPKKYLDLYQQRRINLDGLQVADGKTFRWSGSTEWDMNRRTLSVCLKCGRDISAEVAWEHYRDAEFVFLANISPQLQSHVLQQVKPKFVVADTMDLWIEIAQAPLRELLTKD